MFGLGPMEMVILLVVAGAFFVGVAAAIVVAIKISSGPKSPDDRQT